MGDEAAEWAATLQEWIVDTGYCYAAALAGHDGNFYAAAPNTDEGWAWVSKEGYKKPCLQEDGVTEIEKDVWEGDGLKHAMDTGTKPEWGFYLGGNKYNLTNHQKEFEDSEQKFVKLFAQKTKGGCVCIKTAQSIVVGFYDEEKGQTAGNATKAVIDLAVYLQRDCGY
uniref:Profilin n=1 Tax=Karlodinium veneficum TaxID=407301 RepID=A7YXS2_KARVE|nr:profilin [Karlodinium veneficum]